MVSTLEAGSELIENGDSGASGSEGRSARPSLFHISSLPAPPSDWKWRLLLSPRSLGSRLILSTTSNKSRS
ncbi:hypothetical protein EUGRSUZ_H03130 [Eucalyptus grandis]|uniref:Uncharacterized protein n=2 Tax=Eucalyptus grandis TaxID=71139 RepID=A0ACC3JTL8_EUCGR|nr:hypothetical protein EUGRSUZ_H03130 [Eucalyptus grandis]